MSACRTQTRILARDFQAMLARGIYLPPSQFEALFVSLAQTDADIKQTIECVAENLREIE